MCSSQVWQCLMCCVRFKVNKINNYHNGLVIERQVWHEIFSDSVKAIVCIQWTKWSLRAPRTHLNFYYCM